MLRTGRWLQQVGVILICTAVFPRAVRVQESASVYLGPAPRVEDASEIFADTSGEIAQGLVVDAFNRQAVVDLFNAVYVPALSLPSAWNGSIATCTAGFTSAAYADATIQMVNYFRAMSGLPGGLTHDVTLDHKSQQAALMMSANNSLSHAPPPSWACYSAAGAEAAGKSNLALGIAGPAAITAYMRDAGAGNTAVGHRRWILFPPQVSMGTGSTQNANSLWVIGTAGARPPSPDWVAWPNAGFAPYQVVYPRWSFSVNASGSTTNLAGATVTMTRNGVTIPLTVLPITDGYGDDTIVWEPSGLIFAGGMSDQAITVTIGNVLVGGALRNYMYTVTIIDPGTTGPPSQPGAPTNHAAVATGSTVSLTWNAPTSAPAPTAYVVEAGTFSGGTNVATLNTGTASTVLVTTNVPAGTYFTRVRSLSSTGAVSAASNEAQFTVGPLSQILPPTNHMAVVNGSTVTLTWTPPASGPTPTSYVVVAGTHSGGSNVATVITQSAAPILVASSVPNGTYFTRVFSVSAAALTSVQSNEVQFTVGTSCSALSPPASITTGVSSRTVTVSWSPPPGAVSYIVEAGSATGLADLFNGNVGGTTSITGTVSPGTYFIRVRAVSACGETSGASAERLLVVS